VKTAGKYAIVIIAVCAFVAAGIIAPERLSAYSDRNIIGRNQSVPVDRVEISAATDSSATSADIPMIDKIELLSGGSQGTAAESYEKDTASTDIENDPQGATGESYEKDTASFGIENDPQDAAGESYEKETTSFDIASNPQGATIVPLRTGNDLTAETAKVMFFSEIETLEALGLFPDIEQLEDSRMKVYASLYIQEDAPSTNAVLWEINIVEDAFSGDFYLDDHTGKIIGFAVVCSEKIDPLSANAAEVWAGYLGLEARNIEIQPDRMAWGTNDSSIISCDVHRFELISDRKSLSCMIFDFPVGYGFGNIISRTLETRISINESE
jgi:hypothetical protein